MINAILFYYRIECTHFVQKKNQYHFQSNMQNYCLIPTFFSESYIQSINNVIQELKKRRCRCHEIIPNIKNEFITVIHETPYLLLKLSTTSKDLISLPLISSYSIQSRFLYPIEELSRNHWYEMWCEKIDYFEYQWSQFGKKYPLIFESFPYYVGLAENAISLLNQVTFNKYPITLSRRRIHYYDTITDYYNPLNFIFDTRVREVAEYFKSKFYTNPFVIDEIILYLSYTTLTKEEWILFFIRMLFPTYYFDLFEEILLDGKEEHSIQFIINKNKEYEILLKKLYLFIKSKVSIPTISWLSPKD